MFFQFSGGNISIPSMFLYQSKIIIVDYKIELEIQGQILNF